MNLLIHDLKDKEWADLSSDYEGWTVVTDNGEMHPCIGCFSCWYKDPGRCAIKDGYENMGELIHNADEVVVISRYTYGGFSHSVKNVFDRSLGFILPQFELVEGESHHKKRYEEDKPFTFIFYGHDLSDEQKANAYRYVKAVCTNIRGYVKAIEFREDKETGAKNKAPWVETPSAGTRDKVVLLNGSMRSERGNSAKFSAKLAEVIDAETETIALKDHLSDINGLVRQLEEYEKIVFCVPLYVDGLPAQVIKFLEVFRDEYEGSSKKIYLLANMGLYESSQLVNLFSAVREWCDEMGFEYSGGLGISAGELLGTLLDSAPFRKGPNRKVAEGMDLLAAAINEDRRVKDIFAEPHGFPRWLYIVIANINWNRLARRRGLKPKELYRRL